MAELNDWIKQNFGDDAEAKLRFEFGGQWCYVKKKPDHDTIIKIHEMSDYSVSKTAKLAGVSPATVYNVLKKP